MKNQWLLVYNRILKVLNNPFVSRIIINRFTIQYMIRFDKVVLDLDIESNTPGF